MSKSALVLRRAALGLVMAAAACAAGAEPHGGVADLAELATPAAAASAEPDLAVGSSGRVYLSWVEPAPDSGHALRFAVLGQRGWSAPRTVAAGEHGFVRQDCNA